MHIIISKNEQRQTLEVQTLKSPIIFLITGGQSNRT